MLASQLNLSRHFLRAMSIVAVSFAGLISISITWSCRYTWKIYSERLMTLAGVYGFWKYVSKLERREIRRYLEMFYILKFRDLVRTSIKTVLVLFSLPIVLLTTAFSRLLHFDSVGISFLQSLRPVRPHLIR